MDETTRIVGLTKMSEESLSKAKPEGWGFPRNSQKAHYFIDGMSLCHKWGFYFGELEQGYDDSADNCTACKKALQKLKAKDKLAELNEKGKIEL